MKKDLQLLADANLAVYPIDARGVIVYFPGASSQSIDLEKASQSAELDAQRHSNMQSFAAMTGGKACHGTNDLASCLRDATSDSETYYLLGYYRERSDNKSGWRPLTVTVKRPGVQVLARNGYFYLNEAPDSKEARRREVTTALLSPMDFSGIQFSVRLDPAPASDAQIRKLRFQLQIPASSLIFDPSENNRLSLELVSTAATPKGERVDEISDSVGSNMKPETAATIMRQGIAYNSYLKLPAGEFTLRFVVRDNVNGRIGSIVAPYRVQ